MEKLASIFCHIPNGMLKDEAHRELWRQHDRLAQEANRMGRTIEHCFFHMGEFDLEKPDKVFLRKFQVQISFCTEFCLTAQFSKILFAEIPNCLGSNLLDFFFPSPWLKPASA